MNKRALRRAFEVYADARTCTTRRIVLQGGPILTVVHELDGDWQVVDNGPLELDDLMLVHLIHILDHHPEVLELADLPPGWQAWRTNDRRPWRRSPLTVHHN